MFTRKVIFVLLILFSLKGFSQELEGRVGLSGIEFVSNLFINDYDSLWGIGVIPPVEDSEKYHLLGFRADSTEYIILNFDTSIMQIRSRLRCFRDTKSFEKYFSEFSCLKCLNKPKSKGIPIVYFSRTKRFECIVKKASLVFLDEMFFESNCSY